MPPREDSAASLWWTVRSTAGGCAPGGFDSVSGTWAQFHGRQFFHGPGEEGWFRDDSSASPLLCTLFLSLLQRLNLRSSGTRSQRLGTPAISVLMRVDADSRAWLGILGLPPSGVPSGGSPDLSAPHSAYPWTGNNVGRLLSCSSRV